MISIRTIGRNAQEEFNKQLQELERNMVYPYGSDFFRIDHGKSYFAFFERLGEPLFHLALHNNKQLVACGCGILRKIPNRKGKIKSVWYLCDLKVHPDYRGQRIPARMFRRNLLWNYLKCPRGYTISMNPKEGENRVVRLLLKFPFIPAKIAATLQFFEISMDELSEIEDEISEILGERLRFERLEGIKDIVLESTGKPMPLFHAQYGPIVKNIQGKEIIPDGRYMFCTTEKSKLFQRLSKKFPVVATATVLSHRMRGFDWDFILSSDI